QDPDCRARPPTGAARGADPGARARVARGGSMTSRTDGLGPVVVIGAGVSGTAAAIAAARLGAPGTVVDHGAGASSLATGALDFTWAPASRDRRLADEGEPRRQADLSRSSRDVFDALGVYVLPSRPARLVTTAGVVREARGHDAALLDAASIDVARTAGRRIGVVRCSRPGWDADALAAAWGGAWVAIDARVLKYADERGIPDADFAARHDDDARLAWLAERLREALSGRAEGGGLAGIVLPPSLGVDRPRSQALSERVGVPCGEPIAMPGGPAGLRFERARDRAFATAGITKARASRRTPWCSPQAGSSGEASNTPRPRRPSLPRCRRRRALPFERRSTRPSSSAHTDGPSNCPARSLASSPRGSPGPSPASRPVRPGPSPAAACSNAPASSSPTTAPASARPPASSRPARSPPTGPAPCL